MDRWTPSFVRWFAGARPAGPPGYLLPRWFFLRALAVIYFSVFYSLVFQIRGLLGPNGLLPANVYLEQVAQFVGASRYWYAPTLLWLGSSDGALVALCWTGMIASLLLFLNLWPRGMLVVYGAASGQVLPRDRSASFLRRADGALVGASGSLRRAPACFCFSSCGSASISIPESPNILAGIVRGAT